MSETSKKDYIDKDEFLKKFSTQKLSKDQTILELTEQLYEYEKKYNMRSEIFFKFIVGTPAEDQPDFIDWAMSYKSYFRTMQSKFSLEEITTDVI